MKRKLMPVEKCHELFAAFPEAVSAMTDPDAVKSMVLMTPSAGGKANFFVLTEEGGGEHASFSLFPWRTPGMTQIEPDGGSLPGWAAAVLSHGVPVPRDGSFFGWASRGDITALIPVHTKYTPHSPLPAWGAMASAEVTEERWPPFVSGPPFGMWFWDYLRAGDIRPVDTVIARSPGAVYWVSATNVPGSSCCAVARDVCVDTGLILRRGRYFSYLAARSGEPLPSLGELLEDSGRTDLAHRFSQDQERAAAPAKAC